MRFEFSTRAASFAAGLVISMGAQATSITGVMLDKTGQPVQDAVFYATPLNTPVAPPAKPANYLVSQENYLFNAYVNVIRKGTRVKFNNLDSRDHHVASFSQAKNFEMRIPGMSNGSQTLTFDAVGEVTLVCHFHDSMRGYIYVLDTPYYGKTDKSGMIVIDNLPSGKYKVQAWVPNMISEPFNQIVQASNNASPQVRFKLDFIPKPAPVGQKGKKDAAPADEY
jgi:plastocyanin